MYVNLTSSPPRKYLENLLENWVTLQDLQALQDLQVHILYFTSIICSRERAIGMYKLSKSLFLPSSGLFPPNMSIVRSLITLDTCPSVPPPLPYLVLGRLDRSWTGIRLTLNLPQPHLPEPQPPL